MKKLLFGMLLTLTLGLTGCGVNERMSKVKSFDSGASGQMLAISTKDTLGHNITSVVMEVTDEDGGKTYLPYFFGSDGMIKGVLQSSANGAIGQYLRRPSKTNVITQANGKLNGDIYGGAGGNSSATGGSGGHSSATGGNANADATGGNANAEINDNQLNAGGHW